MGKARAILAGAASARSVFLEFAWQMNYLEPSPFAAYARVWRIAAFAKTLTRRFEPSSTGQGADEP
jgi:hypothetical protein